MTCIVGLSQGGRVTIGGDSAGVAGWSLVVRGDEKVFRVGPYVIGFTSSFRMGQILRWVVVYPKPDFDNPDRFMATTFIDAVRGAFKSSGYMKVENSREEAGCFLVGFGPHLYEVDDDLQFGRGQDGMLAVGCGAEVAIGALTATSRRHGAKRRVTRALEIAERWNAGVRAPFKVLATSARAR